MVLVTNAYRHERETQRIVTLRKKYILVNSDSSLRILDSKRNVPLFSSINDESNV
jgi:hypothetical protein